MKYIKNLFKYVIFRKRGLKVNFKDISMISKNISFGKDVCILGNVKINSNVEIGDYTYINNGSKILSGNIGRFCSIGYDAIIGPEEHPINIILTHPISYTEKYKGITNKNHLKFEMKDEPIIKDNVWIGAKSIILRGVTIGEGAIIGANSVVTKDVPPYAVVVGSPAREVYNRKSKYNLNNIILEDKSTEEILNSLHKYT